MGTEDGGGGSSSRGEAGPGSQPALAGDGLPAPSALALSAAAAADATAAAATPSPAAAYILLRGDPAGAEAETPQDDEVHMRSISGFGAFSLPAAICLSVCTSAWPDHPAAALARPDTH